MNQRSEGAASQSSPSTAPTVESPADQVAPTIRMFGGPVTVLVPAVVFVGVLVLLSATERASLSSFWVGGWVALVVGLILSRTPRAFANSIIRGLSDNTGAVIITAYIFAGVFGSLLAGGGLVNGLLWLGVNIGLEGALFTVLAFVLSCIFAAGTGSSVGVRRVACLCSIQLAWHLVLTLRSWRSASSRAVLSGTISRRSPTQRSVRPIPPKRRWPMSSNRGYLWLSSQLESRS